MHSVSIPENDAVSVALSFVDSFSGKGYDTIGLSSSNIHRLASPVVRAAVVLPVEGVVLRTVAHLEVVQMVIHVPVQRLLLLLLQQLFR